MTVRLPIQRGDPTPAQEKMQDLSGIKTREKWILPLMLRCKQKTETPKNPGTDEMAGVLLEGWPPMAGRTMMIIVVSFLEVVGSQRRRHSQPATDRPVQGTTPSRRRVTPDRPIGGGKGGRRLCGRIPGSAVFLCKKRCKRHKRTAQTNQNRKTTKDKTRTATPPRKQTPRNNPARTTKKKKKQVRERNLGVGVEEEVRVEVAVRGQVEENTRGTPNPKRGFGFPQRLREREEKRKHGVDETNQTQEKKRDTYKKPNTGRGLKGLKSITNTNPRDKNARQTTKEQRPRPEQKNKQRNHTRL